MKPENVLILPGWQNSGPAHWQSRWEKAHGYRRVEQHDWMTPQRGDWMARLEDVVLGADGPVVLVAHSLGCILTAAWAAHSRSTARVRGALLVAPGDSERPDLRDQLPSWSPIVRQRLPFPAVLVGSHDDPYCSFERAQGFAADWGARFIDLGNAGHINADSGLGDWPQGRAWLQELQKDTH
ncbi:MAG: alpha/beta hydrolase [Hydrogenophaga sp.]|uniref:Alpha/beta hydrolase n=1 Tax=Hydrogenophaga crocea TaxID=2716225 RepID=A0A6G8ILH5_9BURK|nr:MULTISPECIES: alpha/beta fold hydrolase [Hydrogenophaga]MBL0943807.1 alpha/beta hydrolase [Hydrogenophaga sp.]QIM53840.1 alpha/beta hydrolase [Hydrogenophaga crocea]